MRLSDDKCIFCLLQWNRAGAHHPARSDARGAVDLHHAAPQHCNAAHTTAEQNTETNETSETNETNETHETNESATLENATLKVLPLK